MTANACTNLGAPDLELGDSALLSLDCLDLNMSGILSPCSLEELLDLVDLLGPADVTRCV